MLQWTTFCLWMVVLSLSLVECDLKCGDQTRNSSGIIALRRPTKSHCTWAIVMSRNLGIRFLISALRVSQTDPNTCQDSYLKLEEVRGERRTLLKDYCKSVSRDYIKTRHNHVMVSAYNVAFKLTWDVTAPKGTKRKIDEMSTPLGINLNTVTTVHIEMHTENVFISFLEEKYIVSTETIIIITITTLLVVSIAIGIVLGVALKRKDRKEHIYIHPQPRSDNDPAGPSQRQVCHGGYTIPLQEYQDINEICDEEIYNEINPEDEV